MSIPKFTVKTSCPPYRIICIDENGNNEESKNTFLETY